MRGEVISDLSLQGRYHILSQVSAANGRQGRKSGTKIRLYFENINRFKSFFHECKSIVKNTLNRKKFTKTSQE